LRPWQFDRDGAEVLPVVIEAARPELGSGLTRVGNRRL
jgi:hypothetical protein